MDPFQAVVLGIIQGLTEYLPISSSAHLILFPWLFGWPEPGLSFDVALHVGTLVAVLAYFWRDWVRLIRAVLSSITQRSLASADARLAWFIVLGTIPGALAGAVGESKVEGFFHTAGASPTSSSELRGVILVSVVTIAMGVVLYLADQVGRRLRGMEKVGLWDALLIGLAQALAIVPGVSRSGATMTVGLFRGLNRETAARFSFMLGAPVIGGAGLKRGYEVLSGGLAPGEAAFFLVGMLTAAAVGFLAIAFMLSFLRRNSMLAFLLYRTVLGLAVLAVVYTRLQS